MKQNELASLLDLSTASISKLVARGMPTDTVGAASAWRRQNLQPSMSDDLVEDMLAVCLALSLAAESALVRVTELLQAELRQALQSLAASE